jgi:superfamily II DNA or RNA helicase
MFYWENNILNVCGDTLYKMIINNYGLVIRNDELDIIFSETDSTMDKLRKFLTIEYNPLAHKGFSADSMRGIKRMRLFEVIIDDKNAYMCLPRFYLGKISDYFMKEGLRSHGRDWTFPSNMKSIFAVRDRLRVNNFVNLPWKITPTDNQMIVANHILTNVYAETKDTSNFIDGDLRKGRPLAHNNGGCIVTMRPGTGKTYLAMYLMKCLNVRTLVIVPNTIMLEQWKNILQDAVGVGNVGYFYGKKKYLGNITLGIVNTFIVKRSGGTVEFRDVDGEKCEDTVEGVVGRFDFIVYDEVHIYCTQVFAKIFMTAQMPYSLGLSATPEKNGFEELAIGAVGPLLHPDNIPGYQDTASNFSANVKIFNYRGNSKYAKAVLDSTGTVSFADTINFVIRDPRRNKLIHDEIIELLKQGKNVFVFSDRLEHLIMILHALTKTAKKLHIKSILNIEESGIRALSGGASSEDIEKAQASQVIMTTYSYSSTGVSIPKMDAMVMATPRKNKIAQIVGRIFRFGSDESIVRDIIDVFDTCLPFRSQLTERRKYYKQCKMNIETIKIDASEPSTRALVKKYGSYNWIYNPYAKKLFKPLNIINTTGYFMERNIFKEKYSPEITEQLISDIQNDNIIKNMKGTDKGTGSGVIDACEYDSDDDIAINKGGMKKKDEKIKKVKEKNGKSKKDKDEERQKEKKKKREKTEKDKEKKKKREKTEKDKEKKKKREKTEKDKEKKKKKDKKDKEKKSRVSSKLRDNSSDNDSDSD